MDVTCECEQSYSGTTIDARKVDEYVLRHRLGIYALANLLFCVFLLFFEVCTTRTGHDPLPYLILLFALCSLPVTLSGEQNGRFSLLVVAGPVLFLFYGFNDMASYFISLPGYWRAPVGSIFTPAELMILCGLSCLFIGYVVAAQAFKRGGRRLFMPDWKTGKTVCLSLLFIGIGLYATWSFQTSVSYNQKVNISSPLIATLQVVGRMMEPVGAVFLSYAYLKNRSKCLLILVLVIAACKLPIGIILNSKEIGISFIAIFLMTTWIRDGKIPLRWLAIAVFVAIFYFPLAYAYRTTLDQYRVSVSKSLDKVDKFIAKASKENERTSGIRSAICTIAWRIDLKTLMEMIVAKTGKEVQFQEGRTLVELPFFFIPRVIWPEKPDVSVGQLFNREFRVSASPTTYISTSFMGEFYWNFGWIGVFIGMFTIGLFWGGIGSIAAINEQASVARMLILVSAIYLLILRFETGVAQQIVLFIRSAMIIMILQFLFACKDSKPDLRQTPT